MSECYDGETLRRVWLHRIVEKDTGKCANSPPTVHGNDILGAKLTNKLPSGLEPMLTGGVGPVNVKAAVAAAKKARYPTGLKHHLQSALKLLVQFIIARHRTSNETQDQRPQPAPRVAADKRRKL